MKNIIINIQNLNKIKALLNELKPETPAQWGSLMPQYMIEHLSSTMKYSNGKVEHKLYTPTEHLEKYRKVLFADRDFPKFFKSPVFEKDLPALNNKNMAEATEELLQEMECFYQYFENDPERKVMHGVFGKLNYQEWLIYHNKHFQHHFNQFGLLNNTK